MESAWEDVVAGRVPCTDFTPGKGSYKFFMCRALRHLVRREFYHVERVKRQLRSVFKMDKKTDYPRVLEWYLMRYPNSIGSKNVYPRINYDDDEEVRRCHADVCLLFCLKPQSVYPVLHAAPSVSRRGLDHLYFYDEENFTSEKYREACWIHHGIRRTKAVLRIYIRALGRFSILLRLTRSKPGGAYHKAAKDSFLSVTNPDHGDEEVEAAVFPVDAVIRRFNDKALKKRRRAVLRVRKRLNVE